MHTTRTAIFLVALLAIAIVPVTASNHAPQTTQSQFGGSSNGDGTPGLVQVLLLIHTELVEINERLAALEAHLNATQTPNVTDNVTYNTTGNNTVPTQSEASINFENQATSGTSVDVDYAYLPEGGYVAIHPEEGDPLGASDYLEAGNHTDLRIEFTDQLNQSQLLAAIPHQETTGDTTLDFITSNGTDDTPYTENGEVVVDVAQVNVTG